MEHSPTDLAPRPKQGEVFDCVLPCEDCGQEFVWDWTRARNGAFPLVCRCEKLIFPPSADVETAKIDVTDPARYKSYLEIKWLKLQKR